jgi:DNA-binding PadR family transcriptional regulator
MPNVWLRYPTGGIVRQSVLDLFILSLLDRGLETSYDLQRSGGLSVGSTIPALGRLEEAGLVRKTGSPGASKRPRHGYQVSAAGRKLARSGWKAHLKSPNHLDLDAVIRVVDMAQYCDASAAEIASFLDAAASERRSPARLRRSRSNETGDSFEHMTRQGAWNVFRLKAEAKFLAGLAKSLREKKAKSSNR